MITHADLAMEATCENAIPTLSGSNPPPYIGNGIPSREIAHGQPFFRAVIKKRFGIISPQEYLRFGYRFFELCHHEYGMHSLRIYRDWREGIDTEETARHKLLDPEQLHPRPFAEVFAGSSSVMSTMFPKNPPECYRYSFAELTWERDRPEALWFYAQSGGQAHDTGGPLCDILYQDLFTRKFRLNWKVRFGVAGYLRERGW